MSSYVMPVITPQTPWEAAAARDTFTTKSQLSAFYNSQFSGDVRPMSVVSDATEIFDTELEYESDVEHLPKTSWESSDSRRRSQTTLSSYDEAHTPSPRTSDELANFDFQLRPVEGPRGPHLFRSSQSSAEFAYEHALQMSPVIAAKEPPLRIDTAFTDDTLTPHQDPYSIAPASWHSHADLNDPEAHIRAWSTQQVIDWMYTTGIDASVIESFEIHDINGDVLLDLHFDDLKELDIQSFGKRHQLWNAICLLRGEDAHPSPTQTPFQDISRPCTTTNTRRSPSRSRHTADDEDQRSTTPNGSKKRRGRKPSKTLDIVTPAESVSIVAIEQLIPKPHKCAKGENCAKWRKQQRELEQLHNDHGFGRFPISPTKGGRIFIAGDPGNATTAYNIIPNVHKPLEIRLDDPYRPISQAQPSAVASSDVLGPGQLPEFALHEDVLHQLGKRDPQDNVKQFLHFQHMNSPMDERPPTPPFEMFPSNSVSPFPAQYSTPDPHEQLKTLPRLEIPRSASAGPQMHHAPPSPTTALRSATASPGAHIYRLNTPATEVDVPVTAIPTGPIARDTSQSVPPNMQYRNHHPTPRSQSRAADRPRPSLTLAPVQENEVLAPSRPSLSTTSTTSVRDPAHHSPQVQYFGYGAACTHAGYMRKRHKKLLRHEWSQAHFRLTGTQLTQHANARLSAAAVDSINVDDYTVACSTAASSSKLAAAMKAFNIKSSSASSSASPEKKKGGSEMDPTAFAFQLVPERGGGAGGEERKRLLTSGKTHHFAVGSKDERIDWMREMMLAKALLQKGKGYEVEVNGVQA